MHLFAIRIPEQEVADETFDALAKLVPPEALERLRKYRLRIDSLRALASRLAPIWFLRRQALVGLGIVPICGRRSKGKPYLVHPELPLAMEYNTSHDGSFLLFGTTSPTSPPASSASANPSASSASPRYGNEGIGVDLMLHPVPSSAMEVQEGITDQLTLAERLALSVPLSDELRSRAVTTLWTLKEGFVKATGEGIGWGLERISVDFTFSLDPDDTSSTAQIIVEQVTIDGLDAADLGWYHHTGEIEGHGWAVWVKGEPRDAVEAVQLEMVEWDEFVKPLLALADEVGGEQRSTPV